MNDLKYGMEGYLVKLLQYALSRAGMESVRPDGIFGRRTARALQEFQREQGLAADGIAGKLTWAALYPYISGYILHRITAGDTLFQLAKRYNSSMQALRIANPALAPDKLPVGYTMVVPFDLPVVADAIPYSSLLTGIILRGLSMRYPFLSLYEIGRSVMGRRIMAVSMGSGEKTVPITLAIGSPCRCCCASWRNTPPLLLTAEPSAAFRPGRCMKRRPCI